VRGVRGSAGLAWNSRAGGEPSAWREKFATLRAVARPIAHRRKLFRSQRVVAERDALKAPAPAFKLLMDARLPATSEANFGRTARGRKLFEGEPAGMCSPALK
jgi:hypothetical protein